MSDDQVYYEFSEFGKYIYYAGICFIISIITSSFGLVLVLIMLLMALQRIKRVNEKLHNPLLNEFYSRLLAGQIVVIIGSVIVLIAVLSFYVPLILGGGLTSLYGTTNITDRSAAMQNILSSLNSMIAPIIIGEIVTFVGYGLAYSAWGKLQDFFEHNQVFPLEMRQSLSNNAGKLKTASLMYLLSFLIITGCIGIIFYLIGYFGLGGDLKDLKDKNIQTQPSSGWGTPDSPQPQKTATTGGTPPKFCTKCGTPIKKDVKFCPVCGNQLKN